MKKLLVLFLITAILLCFGACSSKPDKQPEVDTTPEVVEDTGPDVTDEDTVEDDKPTTPAPRSPLTLDDMYLYDSKGKKTDMTHISMLDTEHSTLRGVKISDSVSILAEKYLLSEFKVVDLETGESEVANEQNILKEGSLDITARMDIDGIAYFLSFTVNDQEFFMISVFATEIQS